MIRNTTNTIKKMSRYLIPAGVGLVIALPCFSVNAAQGVRTTEPYMFVVSFRDKSADKGNATATFDFQSDPIGTTQGLQGSIGTSYKQLRQKMFSGNGDFELSHDIVFNATNMRVSSTGKVANCSPSVVKLPIDKEMVSIVIDYLGVDKDGTPNCKVTTTFA